MAKANPEIKQFTQSLEEARQALWTPAENQVTLRERIRDTLASLTFISDAAPDVRQGAFYLLAALHKQSKIRDSFLKLEVLQTGNNDLTVRRPIQSLGFNRQQVITALAIADSADQSLLLINDHFEGLLKGDKADHRVPMYSSPAVSKLLPKFWSEHFDIIGNTAFNALIDSSGVIRGATCDSLAAEFARSVSQYVACTGLASMFAKDHNLYKYSGVDVYVTVTDSKENISVYCVELLNGKHYSLPKVASRILNMAQCPMDMQNFSFDDEDEDEDEDYDDSRSIADLLIDFEPSEQPACTHSIDGIQLDQINTGFPVFVDFELVDLKQAKSSLFDSVVDGTMIGFSVVLTEQRLSLDCLTEQQQFEISAGLLELAEYIRPTRAIPSSVKCVKPAKGSKRAKSAEKKLSRDDLIEKVLQNNLTTRRKAEALDYDELSEMWEEFKEEI